MHHKDISMRLRYLALICTESMRGILGRVGKKKKSEETECPSARLPALSFPGGGSSPSQLLEGKIWKRKVKTVKISFMTSVHA